MPRTIADIQQIAETKGWAINEEKSGDKIVAEKVLAAVNRIEASHGVPFCPCKPNLIGKKDGNGEYLSQCPCKDADKEIAEEGHCHCHLFVKKPAAS